MTDLGDDEIRAAFQAARRTDLAGTPSFQRILVGRVTAPRATGSPRRILGLAAAFGVAAVVLAVAVDRSKPAVPALVRVEVGQLRMPTDFLLEVLGGETLRTVPAIGRSDDWFPSLGATKGT
jgi:hypothetical protein